MTISLFLLAILPLLTTPTTCEIKGVQPENCAIYQAEQFSCDSKVIPKSYLNDDYCDCPNSGLDEPGTSACSTGKFWCANVGYRAKTIYSSRVNDGICDCCDGSDEAAGACPNSCKEAAYEEQKDMIHIISDYSEGLKAKASFLGQPILDGKAAQITENEKQIIEKQAQLENLRKEREILEEEERIRQAEEEEQRLIEEEKKKEEEATQEDESAQSESAPEEAQPASGEVESETAPEVDSETPESPEPETTQEENFPYPEEYRPPGKENEEGEQKEENFPYPEEYRPRKEDDEALEAMEEDIDAELEDFDDDFRDDEIETTAQTSASVTSDALRQKDNDIRAAERAIKDLEKKNEDLRKFLQMDFGENAAFAALSDQCFSVNVDKYDYEMCLFDKASQKEGSRSTSLGTFKDLQQLEDHTEINFSGGQSCWKGPQRSLKVIVRCGSKNEVLSATEPSMCAYQMEFVSPVACSEAKLALMRSNFENMYKDEL